MHLQNQTIVSQWKMQVQLIKDEFGYDEGFNYHEESDFDVALAK